MTRKIPLNDDQVQSLREDKQGGMSMADIMFKYNIGKSSIYSYMSNKEPESRPNSPESKPIKVQIVPIEEEGGDYLDNIFIKEEDEPEKEEDKNDDVVQEINKNIREKNGKKPTIPVQKDKEESIPDHLRESHKKARGVLEEFGIKLKGDVEEKTPLKEEKKKATPRTLKEPENNVEKIQKIMKIKNYVQTFSNKLGDFLDVEDREKRRKYLLSLSKMNSIQLEMQLEMIRQSVGSVTSHKTVKLGYLSLMEVVERVGGRFVEIEGLRKDLEDNDQIDQVLKELACEYDVFSKYIDPKYRLLGLTGMQLASTYKKNKIIKKQQEIIRTMNTDKTIDDSISKMYLSKMY